MNDIETISTPGLNKDDIELAFSKNLFFVVYQPQVSLNNVSNVFSLEAFVRLNHPTLGVLGPQSFFPLICETQTEQRLTLYIINCIVRDWLNLHAQGYDIQFAVNIDADLLIQDGFDKQVINALDHHSMPHTALTIEINQINESHSQDTLKQKLLPFSVAGVTLSLNDFEDSSYVLDTLNNLPINEIKVKTNVVTQLRTHTHAQATFRKALQLSQEYGFRIVAVGIEHMAEVGWLAGQGCDRGQGYLFGEPMTIADVCEYLSGDKAIHIAQKHELKLLIVEDDAQYRTMLSESLQDIYPVFSAGTCEEAKAIFEKEKPELGIIDVNLPDGSGIDLCKQFNSERDHAFSSVFLSGSNDTVHKLDAFAAGAIDFLVKPCPFSELVAKMGRVAAFHDKSHELENKNQEAQKIAVQSLREAAHYGDVIHFFKSLFFCSDEISVANETFTFMRQKQLTCSIQFRNTDNVCCYCQSSAACSPIEMEVFGLLCDKGRIYEFGERTIFNDKLVSVLIKNMPSNEEERGRIRDYVAVIIEGLEARYKDILRQRVLQTVFQQLQNLSSDVIDVIEQDTKHKNCLVEKFSIELGASFHVLNLTIEQEEYITKITENILSEKASNELSTDDIYKEVSEIMAVVSTAMDSFQTESPSTSNEDSRDENSSDGIELF